MLSRKHLPAIFALEGINSFATTLYFYYLYFFTEKQFGFSKFQNLLLAAGLGLTYGLASIVGGKFGQQRGYFTALKTGYVVMGVFIGAGAFVHSMPAHLTIMFVGYFGAALTWPALEALVSENETRRGLARNVGIYNLVWGGFGALAYFSGGALIKATAFQGMFLVPMVLNVFQLLAVLLLERSVGRGVLTAPRVGHDEDGALRTARPTSESERSHSPVPPKIFLRMAWLANPFAYLAINTVVAVMPTIADRLGLTVAQAGVFCSVWLFVRTGAFLLFWLWPGWHYRFRWLIAAYLTMTVSFVVLLLAGNSWLVIAAQSFFGLALGLIYYSSLYYSMDVGDTKAEHGGFHEAMIGAGSCAGPAIGAVALHLFPTHASSSTWAVMVLLAGGFAGLVWLRFKSESRITAAP